MPERLPVLLIAFPVMAFCCFWWLRWMYQKEPAFRSPLEQYLHDRAETLLRPENWRGATQGMAGSRNFTVEGLPFQWIHGYGVGGSTHDEVTISSGPLRVGYTLTAKQRRLFLQNVQDSWPALWAEVHKDDPKTDEQLIAELEAARIAAQTRQGEPV